MTTSDSKVRARRTGAKTIVLAGLTLILTFVVIFAIVYMLGGASH